MQCVRVAYSQNKALRIVSFRSPDHLHGNIASMRVIGKRYLHLWRQQIGLHVGHAAPEVVAGLGVESFERG